MRFSQRKGIKPVKTMLQVGSIDAALKNRLWYVIQEVFFDQLIDAGHNSEKSDYCSLIWEEFYVLPLAEIPRYHNSLTVVPIGVINYVHEWFYNIASWDEIYDFLEFISNLNFYYNNKFIDECNVALTKEVAGYRIVNRTIVEITSEEEISTIEQALLGSDGFSSVNKHLERAIDMLSDRQAPDYRNSIKESISAVESLCKIITNDSKATLGKALAVIENKYQLHGSLKEAYSKLYGYTSDADGIRHALLEDGVEIKFEDAKFMLVSCSAFINYLKTKLRV